MLHTRYLQRQKYTKDYKKESTAPREGGKEGNKVSEKYCNSFASIDWVAFPYYNMACFGAYAE